MLARDSRPSRAPSCRQTSRRERAALSLANHVSTDKQSRSALGPEGRRAALEAHVIDSRGRVAAEFNKIESGRKRDRPQLAAALAAARAHRGVLVIAKLDRLARNVHFVSGLMESGVEFVAADMPAVTWLTVHILAAVAEGKRA